MIDERDEKSVHVSFNQYIFQPYRIIEWILSCRVWFDFLFEWDDPRPNGIKIHYYRADAVRRRKRTYSYCIGAVAAVDSKWPVRRPWQRRQLFVKLEIRHFTVQLLNGLELDFVSTISKKKIPFVSWLLVTVVILVLNWQMPNLYKA